MRLSPELTAGIKIFFFVLSWFWPSGVFAQRVTSFCASGTRISYPVPDLPPAVATWSQGDGAAGHIAADCTRWLPGDFKMNVALAGSFRYRGGSDGLLKKFGAISTLPGVRYWSVHDASWQTLIADAAAVSGVLSLQRRPDFSTDEMKSGKTLYFAQQDNRSSHAVIYSMDVLDRERDKLVIHMENASNVSFLALTLFRPGDLQSTYFLEKISPGVWGYYTLSGIRKDWAVIGANPEKSNINRAVALYRHFAGIPTDQNPPLAR